ncbi:MAG: hypothetical protein ABII13_02665, partial [Patescibacteria group bacterium]|nr:hypothetical protein [Patescibacteria group bacterium]
PPDTGKEYLSSESHAPVLREVRNSGDGSFEDFGAGKPWSAVHHPTLEYNFSIEKRCLLKQTALKG